MGMKLSMVSQGMAMGRAEYRWGQSSVSWIWTKGHNPKRYPHDAARQTDSNATSSQELEEEEGRLHSSGSISWSKWGCGTHAEHVKRNRAKCRSLVLGYGLKC